VVDGHKAKIWAKIFTRLKVREDLAVNTGSAIGWGVRKNSPLLLKEISAFNAQNVAD
jgi:hypothetical protein